MPLKSVPPVEIYIFFKKGFRSSVQAIIHNINITGGKKEKKNRSETLGLRGDTLSRGHEADLSERPRSPMLSSRGNAGGRWIAADSTATGDGNARGQAVPRIKGKKRNQAARLHRRACSCPLRSLKLHIHMALNTRKMTSQLLIYVAPASCILQSGLQGAVCSQYTIH